MKPLTKAIIGLSATGGAAYVLNRYRNSVSDKATKKGAKINGFVSPGFESVRDAFAENFSHRGELGGARCVYHKGKKVVDLGACFGKETKTNRMGVSLTGDPEISLYGSGLFFSARSRLRSRGEDRTCCGI